MHELSGMRRNSHLTVFTGDFRQCIHVDELHVSGLLRENFRASGRLARRVAVIAGPSQAGLLAHAHKIAPCCTLDPVEHIAQPAEVHQEVDPAHQHDHHQADHEDGDDEQHQPARCAVDASLEQHDAHDGIDEGADEGRKHVLGDRVVQQKVGGARRCRRGCRAICRNHGGQREGRHRQHARCDDRQKAVHRLSTNLQRPRVGNPLIQQQSEQCSHHREQSDDDGPVDQLTPELRPKPFEFGEIHLAVSCGYEVSTLQG